MNYYGIALSNFTLGYIHYRFADELCDSRVSGNAEYEQYFFGDAQQCFTIAMDYYKKAYQNFKKMNHLMGMFMSKAREVEQMKDDGDEESHRIINKKQKKVNQFGQKY